MLLMLADHVRSTGDENVDAAVDVLNGGEAGDLPSAAGGQEVEKQGDKMETVNQGPGQEETGQAPMQPVPKGRLGGQQRGMAPGWQLQANTMVSSCPSQSARGHTGYLIFARKWA